MGSTPTAEEGTQKNYCALVLVTVPQPAVVLLQVPRGSSHSAMTAQIQPMRAAVMSHPRR